MSSRSFVSLVSSALHVPVDDVDTDQIIPARFLKVTDKRGLGDQLFVDWGGRIELPPTERPEADRRVLLAASNFGCGSSREHAPWALTDRGFRVIIARSFGDIFRENSTKNGLLTVELGEANYDALVAAVRANPSVAITVDLPSQRVSLPTGESFSFEIDSFAKHCLLNGIDELAYILGFKDQIEEHERRVAR